MIDKAIHDAARDAALALLSDTKLAEKRRDPQNPEDRRQVNRILARQITASLSEYEFFRDAAMIDKLVFVDRVMERIEGEMKKVKKNL